eukprot:GILI01004055.1.p1 GENE.GILI01004055.1~~GILI01004055.1.p1  ORF type:complete len:273 (-),score=106.86 GILI01004055.1:301-1005(-)
MEGDLELHLDLGPSSRFAQEWCCILGKDNKVAGSSQLRSDFMDVWSSFLHVTVMGRLRLEVRDELLPSVREAFTRIFQPLQSIRCTISNVVRRSPEKPNMKRIKMGKDPHVYSLEVTMSDEDRAVVNSACQEFFAFLDANEIPHQPATFKGAFGSSPQITIAKYIDPAFSWEQRDQTYQNLEANPVTDVRSVALRFCKPYDDKDVCLEHPIPGLPGASCRRPHLLCDFPENAQA